MKFAWTSTQIISILYLSTIYDIYCIDLLILYYVLGLSLDSFMVCIIYFIFALSSFQAVYLVMLNRSIR